MEKKKKRIPRKRITIKVAQILTTGEAANIIGISVQTLVKYCEAGVIKSWKIDVGGLLSDRRINLVEVLRFMRDRDIPISGSAAYNPKRVLVLSTDDKLINSVHDALPELYGFEVHTSPDIVDFVLKALAIAPAILVIDSSECEPRHLKFIDRRTEAFIAVDSVIYIQSEESWVDNPLADKCFRHPFNKQELVNFVLKSINKAEGKTK